MGDIESEQPQHDFEVQVSDLDELDTAINPSQPPHLLRKPVFSPRKRRLYLILLNGLMILAVVLILASTTSMRNLVGSIFIHPPASPTATLVPGTNLFYVQASPPWGHLLIDGRSISLPTIGKDPPLQLARGQHQLVWQATPFLAQRCTISIPSSLADTCNYHETTPGTGGLSAWVLTFSESLATLPGDQQIALLQTAQVALDGMQTADTVRPGEHYTYAPNDPACRNAQQGYQCYATATQPLRATLSFRLDTDETSTETCINAQSLCRLSHQDCRQFCMASSSSPDWDVFVPVLSTWTFATMDGRVLARDVPDDSSQDYATGQTMDESLMQLNITWDSLGWHVALPANLSNPSSGSFNPACAAAQASVGIIGPPADANGTPICLQWQFMSGPISASGCLAVGTPQPNVLTTPTSTRSPQLVVYCLHRFGVLLAVNPLAERSGFLLPHADSYEQQLARQLLLVRIRKTSN